MLYFPFSHVNWDENENLIFFCLKIDFLDFSFLCIVTALLRYEYQKETSLAFLRIHHLQIIFQVVSKSDFQKERAPGNHLQKIGSLFCFQIYIASWKTIFPKASKEYFILHTTRIIFFTSLCNEGNTRWYNLNKNMTCNRRHCRNFPSPLPHCLSIYQILDFFSRKNILVA